MQITDLYKTIISCDKYNPNVNDTVDPVIYVKLEDFHYSMPVVNKSVTVTTTVGTLYPYSNDSPSSNNGVILTGLTDSDGFFKCKLRLPSDYWGLITVSCNDSSVNLNRRGWKTYKNITLDSGYVKVEYNESDARCIASSKESVYIDYSTSETALVTNFLSDSWIRPKKPVLSHLLNTNCVFIIREGVDNRFNNTHTLIKIATTNISTSYYFQRDWVHQGIP